MRTYERVLRDFVDFAQREHGATRLEDISKKKFRAFMDRAIARGLAVKTLNLYRSALAKFGSAVTRQTESFAAPSEKYGWKIRQLAKLGQLPGPTRATPSREVLERAIAILRDWDARHFARRGEPRAHHLAARLQMETACRSISVTTRLRAECLREGNLLMATANRPFSRVLVPSAVFRWKPAMKSYTSFEIDVFWHTRMKQGGTLIPLTGRRGGFEIRII